LNTVFPDYKKINHIDMQQCDINDVSDNSWEPNKYSIYGASIFTNTVPNVSKTVKVFYASKLPEIVTDCILPSNYDLALCYYVWYLALMSVEKNDKAMWCLQTYTKATAKLITDNNRRVEHNFINYNY
jgi:hypothetical protein